MARMTETQRESMIAALITRRAAHPDETHAETGESIGMSRQWVTKALRDLGQQKAQRARPPLATGNQRATMVAVAKGNSKGGRKSSMPGGGVTYGLQTILPPPTEAARWAEFGLDMSDWDRIGTVRLLRILRSMSPDFSRAIWDYLRLLNAGHTITAYKSGTTGKGKQTSEEGQAAINEFVDQLEEYYGSMKVQTGRMFMNMLARGATVIELVLDDTGTLPIDLVVPDASSIRFRRADGGPRGTIWQMGQWQNSEFVVLDQPTLRYIGIDADPDNPYGVPMFSAAIFPIMFLIGLLQDLRRVVAQQGYPRTDIVVKLENIKAAFEDSTDEDLKKAADDLIKSVAEYYGKLEPDDAFVHTDATEVQTNGGAIATNVLASSKALIDVLERQAMRALKTTPLMMGMTEGAGDANASRQWEVFAAGIKSLQQDVETILGQELTLALEVQGIPAWVEVKFAEIRAAEEARDEQTMKLRLENAITARNQGFWSQEQASNHAVHDDPFLDEPPMPADMPDDSGDDEQTPDQAKDEDGEDQERITRLREQMRDFLAERYVDVAEITDDVLEEAMAEWDEVFTGTEYVGLLEAEVV